MTPFCGMQDGVIFFSDNYPLCLTEICYIIKLCQV